VAHNVSAKPAKLSLKLHLIPKTTFERQWINAVTRLISEKNP
jgi:hypothetical protein